MYVDICDICIHNDDMQEYVLYNVHIILIYVYYVCICNCPCVMAYQCELMLI